MASSRIPKSERNVLTAAKVKGIQKPGRYADGGNLYLQITERGSKSWIFRYFVAGKRFHMGLGPVSDVSLADARTEAKVQRELLRKGLDPIGERNKTRLETISQRSKTKTFRWCADAYVDAKSGEWTMDNLRQWQSALYRHAMPKLGNVPVDAIDLDRIVSTLRPIWTSKTVTATRVRSRIESVLDWATVMGYRSGDNPARWRGNLDHLLAKPSRVAPVEHFAALPYSQVPGFLAEVRARRGMSVRALEFCILTATRTTETLQCEWSEIDLKNAKWTIPAGRMKGGIEHVVPLSTRAVEIITEMVVVGERYVFPGQKQGTPLSQASMLKTVRKRMGRDFTVHGMRSSFRDWAAEETHHSNEVVEMALAHTIGDKTEAAYRRGQLLSKRRQLMDDWSEYCATHTRKVVALETSG